MERRGAVKMDFDPVKIELTIEEVNSILAVLGNMPTKSGAWPLLVKIKEQAEEQVAKSQQINAA